MNLWKRLAASAAVGLALIAPHAWSEDPPKAGGQHKPAYLGVFLAEAEEGMSGVGVREVPSDSPAGKAGLKVGDNIVEADGRTIEAANDLVEAVRARKPGDSLKLKVLRDGREEQINVTLGERPADAAEPGGAGPENQRRFRMEIPGGGQWRVLPDGEGMRRVRLGVQLQPIDDALRNRLKLGDLKGALVAEAVPGSPAEKAGIKGEDVIIEADGKKIEDPGALTSHIAGKKAGDAVKLKLIREGKPIEKEVKLEAGPAVQSFRWRFDGENMPEFRLPEGLEEWFGPNATRRPMEEFKRLEEQIRKLQESRPAIDVEKLKDQIKELQQARPKVEIEKLKDQVQKLEQQVESLETKLKQAKEEIEKIRKSSKS